ALVEAEEHGAWIVADAEFSAVFGQMGQAAQRRLQAQLLDQRQVARQDGLADVEARMPRLLQHAHAHSCSRQQQRRDGATGAAADYDRIVSLIWLAHVCLRRLSLATPSISTSSSARQRSAPMICT